MAPFTARLQVTTPLITNPNPRDVITNVFHFTMDTASQVADAAVIAEEVEDCYEALISFLSDEWAWAAQSYKFYNLDDPLPRAPFSEITGGTGVAPTTQASIPREVSLCMSFQGFRVSGFPQARRRGRVYFGPFGVSANNDGRPAAALVTAGMAAGTQLRAASVAAGSWEWVVRSQVAGSTIPVANGWFDNEWDVQRRRGPGPSSRNTWS